MQTVKIIVPFTRQNAKKCRCCECPVQGDSLCVKQNSDRLGDVLVTKYFTSEIMPGLYCSSGIATCDDIDTNRDCICGTCTVFKNYGLKINKPYGYYCRDGAAKHL